MLSFLSDLAAKREMSRIEQHVNRVGGCLWLNHRHKESDLDWIRDVAKRAGRKLYVINPLASYVSVVYNPLRGDSEEIARRVLAAFPAGAPTFQRIFSLMLDGIALSSEPLDMARVAIGFSWMAKSISHPMFTFIDRCHHRGSEPEDIGAFREYATDVSGRLHVIDRTGLCSASMTERDVLSPEEAVREGAVVYAALPIVSSPETPDVTTIGKEMLCDVGSMVLGDFRDVCDALEKGGQGRGHFAYFYNAWLFDHSVKEPARKQDSRGESCDCLNVIARGRA